MVSSSPTADATKPTLIGWVGHYLDNNLSGAGLTISSSSIAHTADGKNGNYSLKLSSKQQSDLTKLGNEIINTLQNEKLDINTSFADSSRMKFDGTNGPITAKEVGIYVAAATANAQIDLPSNADIKKQAKADVASVGPGAQPVQIGDVFGAIGELQAAKGVQLTDIQFQKSVSNPADLIAMGNNPLNAAQAQTIGQKMYNDTYNPNNTPAQQQQDRAKIAAVLFGSDPNAPPPQPATPTVPSQASPRSGNFNGMKVATAATSVPNAAAPAAAPVVVPAAPAAIAPAKSTLVTMPMTPATAAPASTAAPPPKTTSTPAVRSSNFTPH